jgi:hypothetical protein
MPPRQKKRPGTSPDAPGLQISPPGEIPSEIVVPHRRIPDHAPEWGWTSDKKKEKTMTDPREPYVDPYEGTFDPDDLATNDAVAGETVLSGSGDGNDGPTGGSPAEEEPDYAPNDLEKEDIDLDETP